MFEFGKFEFSNETDTESEYKFIEFSKEDFKKECREEAEAQAQAEKKEEAAVPAASKVVPSAAKVVPAASKFDGDYYREDKYVEWKNPLYNTDVITNHELVCKKDFFSSACTECSLSQMIDEKGRYRCSNKHQFCFSLDKIAHCGHCREFGPNCSTCNFNKECKSCYAGYWELGGTCWKSMF